MNEYDEESPGYIQTLPVILTCVISHVVPPVSFFCLTHSKSLSNAPFGGPGSGIRFDLEEKTTYAKISPRPKQIVTMIAGKPTGNMTSKSQVHNAEILHPDFLPSKALKIKPNRTRRAKMTLKLLHGLKWAWEN